MEPQVSYIFLKLSLNDFHRYQKHLQSVYEISEQSAPQDDRKEDIEPGSWEIIHV